MELYAMQPWPRNLGIEGAQHWSSAPQTEGPAEDLGKELEDFMSELDAYDPLASLQAELGARPPAVGPRAGPAPQAQHFGASAPTPTVQAASSVAIDSHPAASGPGEESHTVGTGTRGTSRGGRPKQRRGPRPRLFKKDTCQADGCPEDLSLLSFYYQRNHVCPGHLKAEVYVSRGVETRFCQRCGVGHPLPDFEGSKRSCRKALEKHNSRRRERQASMSMASVAASAGPGAGEVQQPAPEQQAVAQRQLAAAVEPLAPGMQQVVLPQLAAAAAPQQQQQWEWDAAPLALPPELVSPFLAAAPRAAPADAAAAAGASAAAATASGEEEESGGQLTQLLPGAGSTVERGPAIEEMGSFAAIMEAPVVSQPPVVPMVALEPQGSMLPLQPVPQVHLQLPPMPPAPQQSPQSLPQQQQQQPLAGLPSPWPPQQQDQQQQWVLLPRHVLEQLLPCLSAAVGAALPPALQQALQQQQQLQLQQQPHPPQQLAEEQQLPRPQDAHGGVHQQQPPPAEQQEFGLLG